MDDWGDEFREPTETERSARRVLSLAIALINALRPLSSIEIHREFYPEMSDATFRKTFLRDRERLVMAGLSLRNGPKVDDSQTWEVDEQSSFAKTNLITEMDALTLDILLLPLASDSSYPYARDLRLALTKIDRSFDGFSMASIPPEARKRNNNISRLEDCMTARHTAKISYMRADGTKTQRTVAPLGFFYLNNETYMVAMRTDEDTDERPHTYNLDRVLSVREQVRSTFIRPLDFDVRDYIVLPFQIGPTVYDASFKLSDGNRIHEPVSSESMAAAWAIAEGATPLSPASLVDAWRHQLMSIAEGSING
ncbi:MAG: WYL domain-containing protein [Coriobacteriales bacterium]|nr:WYL domain-containing protein [Coriobacteriales bacterium]